ncbi:MAG TPA: RsmE family RNA methyltransferase [Thermoanaerobaculia bacterium]
MRHRVFVDQIAPITVVTGEEFHHSVRVVRLRGGEEVELFDRSGRAVMATVESIEKERATFTAGEPVPTRESPLAIHLAMAIIQLEKFELVLQKATELGVHSIIPLVTDRIELRSERYSGKKDRWERIIFEAVKQSGRTAPPALESPAHFTDVVARPGLRFLFEAGVEESTEPVVGQEITLLIGPEGGWSDEELSRARESGACFRQLGPRRLRAETAAIAATAIVAARFGDL